MLTSGSEKKKSGVIEHPHQEAKAGRTDDDDGDEDDADDVGRTPQ